MLDRSDLLAIPVGEERAVDSTVVADVAIEIRGALPHADGCEMRRPQRGDLPLVHPVIGYAVEPDLTARPALRRRPLDTRIEVAALAGRPRFQAPWRASGAAPVNADAGIPVRHPGLRVDHFPILITSARAACNLRKGRDHLLPGGGIAFLEGETLGIGPIAHNHRKGTASNRAKHVGAQHDAIVHHDRRVPFDQHAVTPFNPMRVLHGNALVHCAHGSVLSNAVRVTVAACLPWSHGQSRLQAG